MKQLVVGMLAHVDAGKTTLSEGLLYTAGALHRLGRVDHRDAFLDHDALERQRGITILAKQAVLTVGDTTVTLLDTPGHVDFSAEMERTLQVLDAAVLVISGSDGVQSHTRTLWRLLAAYQVPTFLFVNKMDLAGADRQDILQQLQQLDGGCVDFGSGAHLRDEGVAMCEEGAMEAYLATGSVSLAACRQLIAQRRVFPCWFGCALKLDGVEALLHGIVQYGKQPEYPPEFGAQIFKISRDGQGNRLTWLKITGGTLGVKQPLAGEGRSGPWQEKADQLRVYSGERFQAVELVTGGMVCAVTGLSATYPGQGLGIQSASTAGVLEPVLSYQIRLPPEVSPYTALPKLRQLEEEDPMLRLVWQERSKEIHVQLMGQIQLEVLQWRVADRFGLAIDFDSGAVVYKETIATPVLGMGHFEPLRHYAEVHLLLEPGERGSGIRLASQCSTDALDINWQRLVGSHLSEREHPGVLLGAPITDIKITLVAGRGHLKHTEGGDFRQATHRAVRQGLMQAQSILLEPCYAFTLEVPRASLGRAITDLQQMGGTIHQQDSTGELALLTGHAPVVGLRDYARQVSAYTRGLGRLSCTVDGYQPCHNQAQVVAQVGYQAQEDENHPADSIFCANGGGFRVSWDQVADYMHVDSGLTLAAPPPTQADPAPSERYTPHQGGTLEQDKQLLALFERTYGKVAQQGFTSSKRPARTSLDESKYHIKDRPETKEYLLVDGYNILFAWEELSVLAHRDLAGARGVLVDILCDYQAFRKCVVILVFDAYKVKGNPGSIEQVNGIHVVYTKEAETADAYIERTTYDLGREHRVRVATSDALEQLIILGHGALRLSARAFQAEVEQTQGEIARLIANHNKTRRGLAKLGSTAKITTR